MSRTVAVLSSIPKLTSHLRSLLPQVSFVDVSPGKAETITNQVEVLIADPELLVPYVTNLPSTKWVQLTWAGVENLLPHLQEAKPSYLLTRFADLSLAMTMTEYVVAQIVNLERNQKQQYENQKSSSWSTDGKIKDYRTISDLTVVVLGLGNIGKQIAQTLKLFGATVHGISRTKPKEPLTFLDFHGTMESLTKVLEKCDYIVNVLPSTNETQGLLNGSVLKSCNGNAVLMNIGRGSVIKEDDLIMSLEQKWISAAILDVFEKEPLPKCSKLWTFPNVVITPHNSGVSRSRDVAKCFAGNYTKYTKGEVLSNILDIHKGY